jgi:hypothetical protein
MTVSPVPHDMVVVARDVDAFAIESHRLRVAAIATKLEERRSAPVRTTGLDTGYPKPRHTTAFGDPSVIVEASQCRDIHQNPRRWVRVFGSDDMCNAQYEEVDPTDPSDVLAHSDIDAAIALANRFEGMLARAWPSRDRSTHPGFPSILIGLAAHLHDVGLTMPGGEFSLWTGRPYGLPSLKVRDARGDFHPMDGIEPEELDRWLPPTACFNQDSRSWFGTANVRMRAEDVDWRVDAIEMLRLARGKAERCSG